jgi:hypothetical protein
MFEVLKGLNYEEANSVVYYTVKALNNINIDELMKINKDEDQRISVISKTLAKNIILRSRNNTEGVNRYIDEMNSILDNKPILSDDISSPKTHSKSRRISNLYRYTQKISQLRSCNWRIK